MIQTIPVEEITDENKQKGKLMRTILQKYMEKNDLSIEDQINLCDTLADKSLSELSYLEKMYNK